MARRWEAGGSGTERPSREAGGIPGRVGGNRVGIAGTPWGEAGGGDRAGGQGGRKAAGGICGESRGQGGERCGIAELSEGAAAGIHGSGGDRNVIGVAVNGKREGRSKGVTAAGGKGRV